MFISPLTVWSVAPYHCLVGLFHKLMFRKEWSYVVIEELSWFIIDYLHHMVKLHKNLLSVSVFVHDCNEIWYCMITNKFHLCLFQQKSNTRHLKRINFCYFHKYKFHMICFGYWMRCVLDICFCAFPKC